MSTSRIPEVFLSEIFGELRIIMEDNKFFFCAMDVCKALGYTNITRELNIHCRQDGIRTGRVESNGVPRIVKFVSEGNVYRLICRSTKPEAEQFETGFSTSCCPRFARPADMSTTPLFSSTSGSPTRMPKPKPCLSPLWRLSRIRTRLSACSRRALTSTVR